MSSEGGSRRAPPQADVRTMFDSVARRYDLVNGLLSFGLDRRWRRRAVAAVSRSPGGTVLDLGCGTGKLGTALAGRSRVVGVDVSGEMLRLARRNHPNIALVQASAFALPFASRSFDAAASGFLLRNLADLPAALHELARVLRAGAPVALLDITEPPPGPFRRLFDAYFRTAAPLLGSAFGRQSAYRYLVSSLGQIPSPEGVLALLASAGFTDLAARRLTGGIVTLFTGRAPSPRPFPSPATPTEGEGGGRSS